MAVDGILKEKEDNNTLLGGFDLTVTKHVSLTRKNFYNWYIELFCMFA